MEITSTQRGQVVIFSVAGSMDALTAPQLNEFLSKQIAGGYFHLVADLARLDYTSSAGLRVLLSAVKEARQRGGDMRLAAVQPNVDKVFEMGGFHNILKYYSTVDDAVASLAASS